MFPSAFGPRCARRAAPVLALLLASPAYAETTTLPEVEISQSPPRRPGAPWAVASDAANRPLRTTLEVDGATGAVLRRTAFAQRHWIDRAIGYGVAAHEGQLFGLANQILGTVTTLGLVVLAVSGAILWWRRRPVGVLGAPVARGRPRVGFVLGAAILGLAVAMPLFGLTLLATLAMERLVLCRVPGVREWLGLRRQAVV